MAKKKLSYEVLLTWLIVHFLFSPSHQLLGGYELQIGCLYLGILFLTLHRGIYVYLYSQKKYWATTPEKNKVSLYVISFS